MIDAHQHFWSVARADYGWLTPASGAIYRDVGPRDLRPLLDRHAIDATIVVQAAPTEQETRFLLAIAAQTAWVAGVVGWTDFDATDAPERVARLAAEAKLVGLRPMVQDLADDRWLARPQLERVFAAMADHRLVLDALVKPRHLEALLHVVDRHPELVVVIDHGAKPPIENTTPDDAWRNRLHALAERPNVHCKLSGLLTEARPGAGDAAVRAHIDVLQMLFSPKRLIWGSDWPVVELGGGYDRWRALTLAALRGLPDEARQAILGGNARRLYLERER